MRISSRRLPAAPGGSSLGRRSLRAIAASRMSRLEVGLGFLLLLLGMLCLASLANAQGKTQPGGAADTGLTREQIESVERQLDAADTSGLWEEYQEYRKRDRADLQATGERVKVGDSVTVEEGELVRGDVVSIGGDVDVFGVVDGDVVAVGGQVILHDGAEVTGDAVAVGGKVQEEGEVSVQGEKVSVNVPIPMWGLRHRDGPDFPRVFFGWKVAVMIVGLLLALLFNAIAGQRLDVVSRRVEAEPGQSFLLGLLGAFGTPIAMLIALVLLAITIVGLLLFPVLVILVALMGLGGLTAVSIAVGRRVGRGRDADGALAPPRSSYGNLAIGYLVLHAFFLVGLLFHAAGDWGPMRGFAMLMTVLGFFVVTFATILGYGAVLLSRLGTQVSSPPRWPAGPAGNFPHSPPPPPPPGTPSSPYPAPPSTAPPPPGEIAPSSFAESPPRTDVPPPAGNPPEAPPRTEPS